MIRGYRAVVETDIEQAREWWARLRPSVPANAAGLWFGLFTAVEGGRPVRTLYVVGTGTFDGSDETAEWAVGPYRWEPDGRYVLLPELTRLPEQPFTAPLDHAAAALREVEPWADLDGVGVAVGYDDGDLVVLHDA